MVKQQAGGTLVVPCNGNCGKQLKVPLPNDMLVRKVEITCTNCGIDTKYALESKKSESAGVIPPGQMTLTKEKEDDDE